MNIPHFALRTSLSTLFVASFIIASATSTIAQPSSWRQLSPTGTAPKERHGHSAIYDSQAKRMIVFGGEADDTLQNDVWVLSLGCSLSWSQLSTSGTPPSARDDHAAIYDRAGNRMIVFGGVTTGGTRLNDAWELTLGGTPTWSRLNDSWPFNGDSICPREGHTGVYNGSSKLIIFGGATNGILYVQDTWELTLSTLQWVGPMPRCNWIQSTCYSTCSPSVAPYNRWYHSATWASGTGSVIFGGEDAINSELKNDTWAWNTSWTQLTFSGDTLPSARMNHRAVYDSVRNRMVVFGGDTDIGEAEQVNDVWTLDFDYPSQWQQQYPGGSAPSERSYHTMIFDPVADRVIVFGGKDSSDEFNDTWELTFDQVAPATVNTLAINGWSSAHVKLKWTASGDDGTTCKATSYDVRYSTALITEGNWSSATTAANPPTPILNPNVQTFDVSVPTSGVYYFALKTLDDHGNISGLSNNVCGRKGGYALCDDIESVPASVGEIALGLDPIRPNPSSGELIVSFTLPRSGSAVVELIDIAGRRLLSQEVGNLGAGTHRLNLADRLRVAPGFYTVRLVQGTQSLTRSAIVVQ